MGGWLALRVGRGAGQACRRVDEVELVGHVDAVSATRRPAPIQRRAGS